MRASAAVALPVLLALAPLAGAQAPSTPPATELRGAERPAASPLPIELMVGDAYASLNLVLSRPLAPASRWGVFHQSTLVAGYGGDDEDDLAMQSLLTFTPVGGFRLTAGAFYASVPGVSPTVGMQFVKAGARWFVLLSPRVNVERDASYSVFSILRYARGAAPRRLYLSMQALNTFDADRHIKSYQWLRVGVDLRGTQLGLGLNLDESGPAPDVAASVGLFVRRDLF